MVQEDQSYIFIPNKEPVATLESKFYSVSGSEEYVDTENYPRVSEQNKSIAAKAVPKQDGVYRYFIRVANTGKIYKWQKLLEEDQIIHIRVKIETLVLICQRFKNKSQLYF